MREKQGMEDLKDEKIGKERRGGGRQWKDTRIKRGMLKRAKKKGV